MKKGFKKCPYCSNEVKAEAIKCQFCKEFLDNKPTKECPFCCNEIDASANSCPLCCENLDKETNSPKIDANIPGRGERIGAFLLDLLLTYSIIGGIINIFLVLCKKRTTLGNMIVGIETINKDKSKISRKQGIVRFFIFNPMFLFVSLVFFILCLFIIGIFVGIANLGIDPENLGYNIGYTYGKIAPILCFILLIMGIVEIFYSCPTYIDKWIGINRIKQKNNQKF